MSAPDETLRKVVADAIAPRLEGHARYLACPPAEGLPMARSELLYLWDDYRTEYLDWAALGNPAGHGHPLVRTAVADQLQYYGHTAPAGRHIQRWPVEYARSLSGHFTPTGAEDRRVLWTEGEREALRMAARLAGRPGRRLAVLDTGWHGWLVDQTPDADLWPIGGEEPCWDRICGLLLATVDDRFRPVPAEVLRPLILRAREQQVPVIADETVTGFGRTGTLWGQEATGLMADVTVLGGAVGGGYPLGAVVADPGFFPDRVEVSGQAGNPVACTAGQATLTAIMTGVLDYVAETGPLLARSLDSLVGQFGDYLDGHHGLGLLRGLRFTDPDRAWDFPAEALKHGLHLAPALPGGVVPLAPALITSTNEISRGVDLLADALLEWGDHPEPR